MADDLIQSLLEALRVEVGNDQVPTQKEKIPENSKDFFPIVKKYCKSTAPNIVIKQSNVFKNAVIHCFKQHYKVSKCKEFLFKIHK